MKYREFTCLYCGAKGIDRSTTKSRKFCDIHCSQSYHHKKKQGKLEIAPIHPCIYNRQIRCDLHKCGVCGWNPKVEQKRKEALGYG